MPNVRVHSFAMSLDGYSAGPDQGLENPLGVGGTLLHEWVRKTATGMRMFGEDPGDTPESVDDRFIAAGDDNVGATLMGRNMFGPIRGEWGDDDWKGWWGDTPPYHTPVFVMTHYPRSPLEMDGGTTFHFVDEPFEAALERALDAAGGKDVRVGGGVSTVQAGMRAQLIDEVHVAIAPVLLGAGERLFEPGVADGYECVEFASSPAVAHVRLARVK